MSFHVDGLLTSSGVTSVSGSFSGQVTGQEPGSATAFATRNYVDVAVAAGPGGSSSVPNAIVGGQYITVTSGSNTTTIASAPPSSSAILGTGLINVVSGTNTITVSADAIVSDSANLTVTSGTSTVTLSPSATPNFTSVTATTVTGTTFQAAGQISGQSGVFSNSLTVSGTPVMHQGVNLITVSGANPLQGKINLISAGATALSVSGNTITVSSTAGAGGGSGITAVVQDTAPQLGGDLDVNGFSITGSDVDITAADDITITALGGAADGDITITSADAGEINLNTAGGDIFLSTFGGGDITLDTADGGTVFLTAVDGTIDLTATVVSGTEYRTGGTVSARRGEFSQGLTVSGIPVPLTGGGGTPGGSNTQIQFNDSSSFGGDADLTWNKTTNFLTAAGTIQATTFSGTTGQFGGTVSSQNGNFSTSLTVSGIPVSIAGNTFPADGRLTLASNTPVITSSGMAATTIYYTPFVGNKIALYDGGGWNIKAFTELSQTTTDDTKSPAAVGNNSVYDLFVWLDSATLRCTRGPAWSTSVTRGTGAGTTELELLDGTYVNKVAITNGPTARRGRYVGTVRSNGSAQIDWFLGGTALGGSAPLMHVWNMYNRVPVVGTTCDSTDSWTSSANAFELYNSSTGNQCNFVIGISEDMADALFSGALTISSALVALGIGLDSTTAKATNSTGAGISTTVAVRSGLVSSWAGYPGIGIHYIAALQRPGSGSCSFYGDANSNSQTGLRVMLWM